MRFAFRTLAACLLVGTTTGIARAEMPAPIQYAMMVGHASACCFLPFLFFLLLISMIPSPKKIDPPRRRKRKRSNPENANDNT